MGAEELEFCQGHVEWEKPVGLLGGGVRKEMEYKGLSPEWRGKGESLTKNVRDKGAKPEEEGGL